MLKMILGAIFGNVAGEAATKVTRAVEIGALIAAATPVVMWFRSGGSDEVFVRLTLTYGEAVLVGLAGWWCLRVSHRAPPPA